MEVDGGDSSDAGVYDFYMAYFVDAEALSCR